MKYKPLTMKELEQKEGKTDFNVVSTFSGAGGSCMGLKLAGFNILYAIEFIPAAQKVYEANHHHTYLEKRDIRKITTNEILKKTNLQKGELDLLEGSPPCASFSRCGAGKKYWGQVKKYSDTKQRVDDLFLEFNRLLKKLQPKMFITENVNALADNDNKAMFNLIYSHLTRSGYNIQTYILNSLHYGIPQQRKRLFFVGIRKDLNIKFNPPKGDTEIIPVKKAVPFWNKYEHRELNINKNNKAYKYLKIAQQRKIQITDLLKEFTGKNSWFNFRIVYPNTYSSTLTTMAHHYHDKFPRPLSIPEIKRIQTFPDDFNLLDLKYDKQWERIGRSVPPRLMEQIGLKIKQTLEAI